MVLEEVEAGTEEEEEVEAPEGFMPCAALEEADEEEEVEADCDEAGWLVGLSAAALSGEGENNTNVAYMMEQNRS